MVLDYTGKAPALERGLELLEYISSKDEAVSFTELEGLGIPKSTLNRLLTVLCGMSYLEKTPKGYLPGRKCNISGTVNPLMEQLRRYGSDLVKELSSQTGNTCVLFYWNGSQTQVLAKYMNENSLSMQAVGNISADFIRTPWGWILLSSGDINPGIVAAHGKFIKTEEFTRNIAFYQKNGFALDTKNHIIRLAVPVTHQGKIIALLGIGGTPYTMPPDKINDTGSWMITAAKKLSGMLK